MHLFQKLYIDFLEKYPRSKRGNSYIFIVIGVTPLCALFGNKMYTHYSDYSLARKLTILEDNELRILNPKERLELIHDKIKKNLNSAYEKGGASIQ